MRKQKIFITEPLLGRIATVAGDNYTEENKYIEWIIAEKGEKEELLDLVPHVDILVVGRQQITREILEKAEKVHFIQQCGAGYDNIDVDVAHTKNIVVATCGPAGAISVAEHTILLMLAVAKRLPLAHYSTASGEWLFQQLLGQVYEVYEKVLGIIGLGSIGKRVAHIANALGMNIQYCDLFPCDVNDLKFAVKYVSLNELLRTSDFVSIHSVLTEKTRHMIGKDQLNMMKPTSYLINTARGAIVDEDALADILEEGGIAGAGLDVFGEHIDGPKSGAKILKLPNVVLTPHLAGCTAEAGFRMYYVNSLENVMKVIRKEEPFYVVGDYRIGGGR